MNTLALIPHSVSGTASKFVHKLKLFLDEPTSDEEEWQHFADSLAKAPFIKWLANEVAAHLIAHHPRHATVDDLVASVDDDSSGEMQHCAERFIERRYEFLRFDAGFSRSIIVFRHLIQHRLRSHDKYCV